MARKKTTKRKTKKNNSFLYTQKNNLIWLFFLLCSIMSFWIDTSSNFWYFYNDLLISLFWSDFIFIYSPLFLLLSIFLFKDKDYTFNASKVIWIWLYLTSLTTFFALIIWEKYYALLNISNILIINFGFTTSIFLLAAMFFWSLLILFWFSIIQFIFDFTWSLPNKDELKKSILNTEKNNKKPSKTNKKDSYHDSKKKELEEMMEELERKKKALEKQKNLNSNQMNLTQAPKKIKITKIEKNKKTLIGGFFNKENESSNEKLKTIDYSKWDFPQLDLLDDLGWKIRYDENLIKHKELEIQEKLLQFRIDVEMKWFTVWPTVIQYRLKPKEWVKLQKIENLKKDLTLALHAKSIRIQAPIPWQWVVWIEVPNPDRQIVWLKEIIDSREFNSKKNLLPISLWKDVNWDIVVWDLTKMPHLLVAWQTASWKSIWMNSFLISMLYKFSPSELKFIMIDPKMVELSVYNWIPHLLTPVVTNPDKATNALKWAVAEMLRRYDLAKKVNARNLQEYNAKVSKNEKLPFIVIVIDELADLMMSWNKKEVEGSIARIAQMARAVWMHLIVATQRPSVDVITWLIKANIPSRIAFTVASQIDSRTVIDKAWAEDLLWRWDMLYYPTWSMAPERVQWVLVETHEVEQVVNHIKMTVDPDMIDNLYDDSIVNWKSKTEWSILENYKWDQEEDPEIIEKAIKVVKEAKKWSTSLIQRKLSLWYARAAKVLDILEELWVVWPANWSKPREVYID